MSDKPSYLGLLNAIAVGEAGGEALFEAWAAATPNDDVRAVLTTVALREGEHARQFTKRINELGYSVIPKDDPGLPDRVAMAERHRPHRLREVRASSASPRRPQARRTSSASSSRTCRWTSPPAS